MFSSVSVWLFLILTIISAQVCPQSGLYIADASEAGDGTTTYSDVDLNSAYFKNCIWKRFSLFIPKKRSGVRPSHSNPWLRLSKRPKNNGKMTLQQASCIVSLSTLPSAYSK